MAKNKTKTFAEKMLKSLKPQELYNHYRVITIGSNGRTTSKIVSILKTEDEPERKR